MEALRTTRYKYIEYQGRKPWELFDLRVDPRERYNLMDTMAGRNLLPNLQKRLAELRKGAGQ
jgi:arylsulfatase A-like enzyme